MSPLGFGADYQEDLSVGQYFDQGAYLLHKVVIGIIHKCVAVIEDHQKTLVTVGLNELLSLEITS